MKMQVVERRIIMDASEAIQDDLTEVRGALEAQQRFLTLLQEEYERVTIHLDRAELAVNADAVIARLEITKEEIERRITSVERGEDPNIALVMQEGDKCKEFYLSFRTHMSGLYKYLHIFVTTGYLDTPLGKGGSRVDSAEHMIGLGLSLTSALLPMPFGDLIDCVGGEIIYRVADKIRGKIRDKVNAKFKLMFKQLQAVEGRGEGSVENFCRDVSKRVVDKHKETINALDLDKIDLVCSGLVKYMLEMSVGGREDIDSVIASVSGKVSRFGKMKTGIRKIGSRLKFKSSDKGMPEDSSETVLALTEDDACEAGEAYAPEVGLLSIFTETTADVMEILQLPDLSASELC